ncbi:MAG: non-canonical purine NTP pyrophosphatase, partial [Spirochaetales bacterium]|nr:non-canonical purine NTP pyrophosphatase [Spirochaetales bacterium]
SGSGGFGYDPIVYLPERGKTVAQLSDRQKDALSHRGKAARRLAAMLSSQLP